MDDRTLFRRFNRWHITTTISFLLLALFSVAALANAVVGWPDWSHPLALDLFAGLATIATGASLIGARPTLRQLGREADQRELLALVARHTDNAVIITDATGITEWVNDGFTRITGYTLDDIRGKRPGALLQGPQTDQAAVAAVRAAIAAGRSIYTELMNYHKEGHTYWLGMNITPIFDASGRLRRFIAIERDISAQKGLERLLRSALKDASDLTNALNQAAIVAITDKRGRIIEVNEHFCAISGYQRAELIGADHRIVNSGVHPKAFFGELWHTIEQGQIWRGEICNRARDGALYWVDSTIVPLLDATGEPERYLAIRFDITTRKELELALRNGEEELRFQKTLLECQLDTAIDGILVVNPERRWLYANRRFVELWNLPADVVSAGSCSASMPIILEQVEDPEQMRAAIEALYAQPLAAGHAELRLRDGRTFERYTAPVRSDDGTIYGRVWYYRDISERKVVEQMKNEFVSVVSHELRTPLTSIRGALGLVNGGVAGELPPQARKMIDIAIKNSDRLIRLINDILDIEKIESGKMAFRFKPIDLRRLITATLEANRAYAAGLNVALETAEPLPALYVHGDADRLNQVLTNLLANAAKFSPPGAAVVVGAETHNGMARVTVRDAGPGIPEAFRERIFQKFAQADSSNTRRQGGTGLGLSISRAIVERHHGRIGFTTELNVGTTFYVDLPALPPPSDPVAEPPPRRVVVCTPETAVATMLAQVLAQAGFTADHAPDLATVQALLNAEAYAGIVIGLTRNGNAEREWIQAVDADGHTCDLPIVAVAAHLDDDQPDPAGTAVAVTDWLSTQLDPEQLIARVQRALAHAARSSEPAQILHVEDDPDIAQVVALLLGDDVRLTNAATLTAARTELARRAFDLIILDLGLPDGSGLQLLTDLGRNTQPPPVLIFSVHDTGPELPPLVTAALVKSRTSNGSLRDTISSLLNRQRSEGQPHDDAPTRAAG
jgi:PAS domain S-box-containing protein